MQDFNSIYHVDFVIAFFFDNQEIILFNHTESETINHFVPLKGVV